MRVRENSESMKSFTHLLHQLVPSISPQPMVTPLDPRGGRVAVRIRGVPAQINRLDPLAEPPALTQSDLEVGSCGPGKGEIR